MNFDALRRFIARLGTPFIPLGRSIEALRDASVNTRTVHRVREGKGAKLALELEVQARRAFVDVSPAGWAFIHHFGWREDELANEWEPVIASEDMIDAILEVLDIPPLGPRAWFSSEWTVRARATKAMDALQEVTFHAFPSHNR